jgi:uncharacterized protein (TIGR02680 family)
VTARRLRPHRMGVVGLYEYADQVFSAEDGRLALRGRNTSGKSKALELLVPFVLDGDITPRKLDPFASSAKTMRWNLIECTDPYPERRATKRIGYAWAEFRGLDEDGGERWVTCGVGLEATRHTDGVKDRWYFTTAQRIGAGLELTKAAGNGRAPQPVGRRELAEQLAAGGGELHDGPVAYKEALRARVLPFATPELYEQMLEVVRQLRKPKLSESLNVARLSEMLSSALPAVDEELVRRLGDALEQLHELQRAYDDLRAARGLVASIAEREYRSYARAVLAVRAERLRRCAGAVERARSRARAAAEGLEAATAGLSDAQRETERLEGCHARVGAEYDQLVRSEAFEVVAVLDDRARECEEAGRRAERAERTVDAATRRTAAAAEAVADERRAVDRATEALRAVGAELEAALQDGAMPAVALEAPALLALPGRLAVRRRDIERGLELAAALDDAVRRLDAVAGPLAAACTERDGAAAAVLELEAQVERALESLAEGLDAWRAGLTELDLPDGATQSMVERAAHGEPIADAVRALTRPRGAGLAARRGRLEAERAVACAERDEARARVADLETATVPAPAARPRQADRVGRPGAPLWAVCDFRPDLPAPERAALEASLEEAGLLDAWISVDGTIHADDISLVADVPAEGRTLADLLVPDPGERPIAAAAIAAVLRSVPLDGLVSAAPGRFRFGALHGRARKPEPEFVGAAARAAHHERLLTAALEALETVDRRLVGLDAEDDQVRAAEARLEEECATVPSPDALRSAQRAERIARQRLDVAERHVAELVADRDRQEARVVAERTALDRHAREACLPPEGRGLHAADRAVERAQALNGGVLAAVGAVEDAAGRERRARAATEEARRALDGALSDQATAMHELAAAEGRLEAVRGAHGASAEELRARAAALRGERDGLDDALRAARGAHGDAIRALKDAEHAGAQAAADVESGEAERVAALDDIRCLGAHDLFSAALRPDAAPEDERGSESWTLTTALERLRGLPALDAEAGVEGRARRVGAAVSHLQRRLVAFDMDAATVPADGLTLVEIVRDGRRMTPPGMLAELDVDLEHREHVLSAKRREVLGRALLEEIAEHLRTRIAGVRASVRARNETLRRCPTGAGRTVSLAWEVDEDRGAPRAVLDLLADRSAAHLPEAERDALFGFLESRIADARAGADDASDGAIVGHLAAALDYRRWWRFQLYLHERDGSRRRLTARTQGLGSGGEQSVLMHLPLFATAAALYDLAPGGPRIVALDEAMDGIDPLTREQMFALLVELDLDWVMTSYDLNPCVATVPGVGFYELHRDNAEWGVWAQHFVWDGARATEVVDG